MRRTLSAVCALVLASAAHHTAWAQGCAMCGTAITSANDPLAKGMALSIVFMLLVPNLLILSIGGWIIYVYRRAALARIAGVPGAMLLQVGEPILRENGREPSRDDAHS